MEVGLKGNSNSNSISKSSDSSIRIVETILRMAPIAFCITALVVMIKNSENNDYGSVSYKNLLGFKYFVYANAICAGYSLFSFFFTARRRTTSLSQAWIVFFFDQVFTYVILAAATVCTEILYLAYKGDKDITWSAACDLFGGFCKHAMTSVGVTFGAVICYVFLSIISSYRLFTVYDSPIHCFSGKAAEISAFPG